MPEAPQTPPPEDQGTGAQPGGRKDPYRSYNFQLEVPGLAQSRFTRLTGLGVSVERIEYREGGGGPEVIHVPGRPSYSTVKLHYGLTDSRDLWDWMEAVARGEADRRNVSILMLDTDGVSERMRWSLINAWPVALTGATLDALGHELAVEVLELCAERIERA